jgi:hypothetical protein
MTKPTFADFLKRAHAQVHEPKAGTDPTCVFDIGYALGKLTAHYKRKMTESESEEFDRGMMNGYEIGHLTKLQ